MQAGGGVSVGVTTCWEVIFDRAAREAVLNGAQMLAVPSNNATFNEQMSRQQLAFAKIRAIEHGRSVVVAGTTGISAVITPPQGRSWRAPAFFSSLPPGLSNPVTGQRHCGDAVGGAGAVGAHRDRRRYANRDADRPDPHSPRHRG